jgi:hypothetical protein
VDTWGITFSAPGKGLVEAGFFYARMKKGFI